MKRMFVFLFVILCLCFVFSYKQNSSAAIEKLDGVYSLYLNSSCDNIPSFAKVVQNGSGQIVECEIAQMGNLFVDEQKIMGESIRLNSNNYTYDQICNIFNFRVKKAYEFSDGLQTFYGEASYGDRYVYVGSKKINCEIAINNGFIYVGFPVILGSY